MTHRVSGGFQAALAAALLGLGLFVVSSNPALAACHRFTVEATPQRVSEGANVRVTVTRDAAVAPSSIDVETIDDTATANQDFAGVERTVAFTGDDTKETFDIAITNDSAAEPEERFKLHLSNPDGCPPNTNYDVGDDAEVTIAASDAPGATGAPAAPATTARPPSTPAPDTSVADVIVDDQEDDDGVSSGAIVAAIVVALAVATAGFIAWRRRMGPVGPGGPGGPGAPGPV